MKRRSLTSKFTLHQHQFRIPHLALPTQRPFPTSLPTFYIFLEAVEPYLQRHPDTDIRSRFLSRLTYPTIFPRLYISILIFLEAVKPNLQRHLYTNFRLDFPFLALRTVRSFPTSLLPF